MPETFPEQLSRVRMMSTDNDTWDLSDNDQAALKAVCAAHDTLVAALRAAEQFLSPGIPRGPAIDGWQNTVDLVKAALAQVGAP